MKKRILSAVLALALCTGLAIPAFAANTGAVRSIDAPYLGSSVLSAFPSVASSQTTGATEEQIFQAMVALEAQYPSWSPWTDDNYYKWKGGIFSGGYGCVGFAFMLSDAAFGDLPARKVTEFEFSDVRVGDILRIYNNTHSTIVLEVHDDYVVTADGNVLGFVLWGNTYSADEVLSADYLLTRYPVNGPVPVPASISTAAAAFTDIPSWCADSVAWAVDIGITTGTGNNKFSPDRSCTHEEILTFLYRAARGGGTASVDDMAAAVSWARGKGMIGAFFDPKALCTRADAVTYIWQAFGKEGAPAGSFSDVPANADYAAVNWAVANGVTEGVGDGRFSPDTVCNRGQIVTFLHRAYVPSVRLK